MKLKALIEKRNALLEERDEIVSKAQEETRAFEETELTRMDEIKAEIARIDKSITALEEVRDYKPEERKADETEQEKDEKRFLEFCKGNERAFDVGANGAVIPTHIANRIIDKVKELSPIYSMATVFNVGGDLAFPVYDETAGAITAAYVEDMTELTESNAKFTTVKLQNFIIGTLTKISRSLLNRTDINVLDFIINKVAQAIAEFLERQLIQGTTGKMSGLSQSTNIVTTAVAEKLGADDLIDAQMAIPEVYQSGACWIMHKNTLKGLRKLKTTDGEYLLNRDITTAFGWSLLGKPVYITESCEQVATGKKAIFYGDMSGLYVKLAQNVELQMLMEKYATQHAIGVVGYVEADSKIIEPQKIVAIEIQ